MRLFTVTASLIMTLAWFPHDGFAKQIPSDSLAINRYTEVKLNPKPEQQDLLKTIIEVQFEPQIETVGQALVELLEPTGYRLDNRLYKNNEHYYLYALPLPVAHRAIGPMRLRTALEIIGAPGFRLVTDNIRRTVHYEIAPEHHGKITPLELKHAKSTFVESITLAVDGAETSDIATETAPPQHYTVSLNDTLLDIALTLNLPDVTHYQTLIALFDANPHAFLKQNINVLKTGVELTIPAIDMIKTIDVSEAQQRVWSHHERWESESTLTDNTEVMIDG